MDQNLLSNLRRGLLMGVLPLVASVAMADCDLTATAVVTPPSCGASDGAIDVTPLLGTPPYSYTWSTGATTEDITGVSEGSYWVFIEDFNKCTFKLDVIVECEPEDCQFRTQTPGGWGAPPNGNNPGAYLHANFGDCFPNGLTIGCNNTLVLTSAQAITDFLPSGGSPKLLPAGTMTDPTGYNNVFAGHLVAATLAVTFDMCDPDFGASASNLADAEIAYGPFQGWTVQMLLDEANDVIGGCGGSYSKNMLKNALDLLNQNYVDGDSDNGFIVCGKKSTKMLSASEGTELLLFPNPAQDILSVRISAERSGTAQLAVFDLTGRAVLTGYQVSLEEGVQRMVTIDVNELNAGSYMLVVTSNGTTNTKRFNVVH